MPSDAVNTVLWVKSGDSPWWPAKVCSIDGLDAEIPEKPLNTLVYFYQSYNAQWVDVNDPDTVLPLDEAQLSGEEAERRIADAGGDESLATSIREALSDIKSGGVLDLMSRANDAEGDEVPATHDANAAEGSDDAAEDFGETQLPMDDIEEDEDDFVVKKKEKKSKKSKKEKKEKKEKKRDREKTKREPVDSDHDEHVEKKHKAADNSAAVAYHNRTQEHEKRFLDTNKREISTRNLELLKEELELAIANKMLTEQRRVLEELTRRSCKLHQLKETGIGKTVVRLINTPLQPLAKVLVQMWKARLPPPRVTQRDQFVPLERKEAREPTYSQPFISQDGESPEAAVPQGLSGLGSQGAGETSVTPQQVSSLSQPADDAEAAHLTALRTRLYEAFHTTGPSGSVVPAAEDEAIVHCAITSILSKLTESLPSRDEQRARFRLIDTALRDPKNESFRSNLLSKPEGSGYEAVVTMAPADMANPDKRDEILATTAYERDAMRTDYSKPAVTEQFRCGRCGKNRTTYFQMQTRSADEPMTTFVTCIECGNAWKFC